MSEWILRTKPFQKELCLQFWKRLSYLGSKLPRRSTRAPDRFRFLQHESVIKTRNSRWMLYKKLHFRPVGFLLRSNPTKIIASSFQKPRKNFWSFEVQDLNRVEVERPRTAVFSSWGKKKKSVTSVNFFSTKRILNWPDLLSVYLACLSTVEPSVSR